MCKYVKESFGLIMIACALMIWYGYKIRENLSGHRIILQGTCHDATDIAGAWTEEKNMTL